VRGKLGSDESERIRGNPLGRNGSKIVKKTRPEIARWKTCNNSLQAKVGMETGGVIKVPESARTTPLWVGVAWGYEANGELKKEKKAKTARRYCVGAGTEEANPWGGTCC
jgi:hypothetical protein